MSENLRSCLKQLEIAFKLRDEPKKRIILKFLLTQNSFHKALKEICKNIMLNNIELNSIQKGKIKKYAKIVTQLGNGIKERRKRQEMIRQTGGFLPWLVPIIITLLQTLGNKQ